MRPLSALSVLGKTVLGPIMQTILLHVVLMGSSFVIAFFAKQFSTWRHSHRDRLSVPKTTRAAKAQLKNGSALDLSRSLESLQQHPIQSIGLDAWQDAMFLGRSALRNPAWKCAKICKAMLLAVTALAASTCAEEPAETWTNFQNGGQSTATTLPTTWSADSSTLAWQADVTGYGQSSPVVLDAKIFLTSTSGPMKEKFHVSAFGLADGKQLWKTDFENPTPEENSSYVSRAAPSATVDSNAVYVLNEGGVLASMDHEGNIRWQRNLVADYGAIKARHGLASSLEQDAKHLFVWIERGEDPYLMAVDKASGETKWKVAGLGSTTWGSPRLIQVGDTQQLVCSASGKLVGFNPATGDRHWELTDIVNNTSSTPIPAGSGRFFIGASNGRGEESAGKSANSGGLVEITTAADKHSAKFLWRAEKANCSFGSPVVAAGKVWIVNRSGALYQLDVETGKQLSVTRVKSGSIWATPICDANRLFLFGQKGTTSIVSTDDGTELETNSLWEVAAEVEGQPAVSSTQIQYAAAAANGTLLIRRGDRLYAIR